MIAHTTSFLTPIVEQRLEQEIAQWVCPMRDWSDYPSHHEQRLYLRVTYNCDNFISHSSLHCFITINKGCLWDCAYKTTLLLIRKSSLCGGSGFPLSLSEWSFTIYVWRHITVNKMCSLSASLNTIFPSCFITIWNYFNALFYFTFHPYTPLSDTQ